MKTTTLRTCLLTAALAAPLSICLPARASHVGEDVTLDAQTVSATTQLVRALGNWERTPATQRPAATARLVQLAQARQTRLLALLERNPQVAAARLLPAGVRERMPPQAQAFAEEDMRLSGEVFGRVSDNFQAGVSRTDVLLRTNAATVLQLHLAESTDRDRTMLGWVGRRVTLDGTRIDGRVLVKERGAVTVAAADGTGTTTAGTTGTPTITPKVIGDQKTLVILANFSDAALSCSVADVSNRVFGTTGSSVNTSFRQSSRDLVSFSGQVVGPFSIPYSAAGTCDYTGWAGAADGAARAAGFDPAQYQRVSYVTPSASACGWAGLAYLPGRQSWVQSCGSTGVYTHEFGHNLLLHHAATPTAEYGDGSDPMGGARNVRNNAANQVMAGWLPTGSVVDVFTGGTYAVAALDAATASSAQVLRLVKTDTNESYYVSLRQAFGLDAGLPAAALNTLSVHRATGTLPTRTYLLQYLAAGQSFVDSVNGIQITNQGLAGNVATVGVTMNGSTCALAAPSVALAPATTSGAPGAARSLTVSVKNNNTAACGTSGFTLAPALPAGFSGVLSSTSLALAAGSTGTASWTVTPAAGSAEGSYGLDLAAGDGKGPATTAHASYTVVVDNGGPVLSVTNPVEGARIASSTGRLTLSATASDSSGVSAVEFWVGGKLLLRDTSAPYSATWNIRKAAKTSHVITVRAVDTLGNATTQTVNVTLF